MNGGSRRILEPLVCFFFFFLSYFYFTNVCLDCLWLPGTMTMNQLKRPKRRTSSLGSLLPLQQRPRQPQQPPTSLCDSLVGSFSLSNHNNSSRAAGATSPHWPTTTLSATFGHHSALNDNDDARVHWQVMAWHPFSIFYFYFITIIFYSIFVVI